LTAVARYVVVGSRLAANEWLHRHGVKLAAAVVVSSAADCIRLRGLDPAGLRIVVLSTWLAARPEVEQALASLRERGAQLGAPLARIDVELEPGEPAAGDGAASVPEPQVRLAPRPAAPGAA
jgi:hypothetical protein